MMQSLPSPRYLELRTHADVDNDAKENATSDQEGSLLGMEDEERAWSDITARDPGVALRRMSRRQRIWSALVSIRSLLDTVLLVIILGLSLERGWQKPSWFEVGGDVAGFAPRSKDCTQSGLDRCKKTDNLTVSQQIKSFVPDPMFIPANGSEFFTDAVRARWLSIVPRTSSVFINIRPLKDVH